MKTLQVYYKLITNIVKMDAHNCTKIVTLHFFYENPTITFYWVFIDQWSNRPIPYK
ncbi:hypothetical protein RhiirC2_738900 [Rhizophagus irregularis]|uniref:Uncharacterized protein n=1 Tax=Rhizophagus irregularis TaxID=588596 RepID=A0A2N1NKL0_9GLOM|nr:hypothetical protein RhiirC2_738900 [Rhizophagus irregularis]